ncbi:hypothetical protein FDECE_3854 [Fusarium decemcellulare]|nr:hypothetical protein FDECE_3854 [Fusarium decemcellulare]
MPTDTPVPPRRQSGPPTTESQRLKKRESDRKAQRVSRERTKSRIAYLEDLVDKLSSQDDNYKTLSLMAQLSEVTEQRDRLARFLESTSVSFTKHLAEAKNWETCKEEQPQAQPSLSGSIYRDSPTVESSTVSTTLLPDLLETSSTGNERGLFTPNFAEALPNDVVLDATQVYPNQEFWVDQPAQLPPGVAYSVSDGRIEDTAQTNGLVTEEPKPPCDCVTSSGTRRLSDGTVLSRNIWQAGNETLKNPSLLSTSMLKLEDDASEDVPVRVVLYGWDHLAQSGRMTALWRKIRHLDEICFSACGEVERLAVIHMVHLFMRAYADPTSSKITTLPRWYIKSTSAQDVAQNPAVDYFAWPSFRRQFSRYPHRYCSNLFWHMFKEHLRIAWPYEFRDAFMLNVRRDSYGLSPLFRDSIYDLGSWTMRAEFFTHFPALIHEVPKFHQDVFPMTIHHPAPVPSNAPAPWPRNKTPLDHRGTPSSTQAQDRVQDASEVGEDDQGWSCDTTVGDYNWCLDNL